MVKLIGTSEIGNFLDTGTILDFIDTQTLKYAGLLSAFDSAVNYATWTPVSLAATRFVFSTSTSEGYSFDITIDGSGLSPVSSFADLQAAFEAGLANGSFSKITVMGSKSAQFPGDTVIPVADFLTIDLSATGYTMTSGDQVIAIAGTLPTSLNQFFQLSQIGDQIAVYDTLSNAQKTQLIADMNAFGINSFGLTSGGVELFEFATTATKASLTVMGYKVTLTGSFSSGSGDVFALMNDLQNALVTGSPIDFSNFSGMSVTRLKVFNPDGDVILRTVGSLGTSATLTITETILDGITVTNLITGENTSNGTAPNIPGDVLTGTSGVDHIFGLAGHDTLNGGKGKDFLFGGTGNDTLDGGNGSDVLNAGSNKGFDRIIGSKGNDTLIFSDSGEGYQEVDYSGFARGINAVIKGLTNTGTITKGNFGQDTLVDVDVPMKAGGIFTTGGFGITGSAMNDTFNLTNAKDGWMQVRGGDGVDSYVLKLSPGSIIRMTMWDGTNAANVNLKTGTIIDDGYGNTETLKIVDNGGQLEIYGTRFGDTFVGSSMDERFILYQGNDTVDGRGGTDLVRYDRAGVGPVNVNLTTGTATGIWWGQAFTDTLKNIEDVRGSRDDADTLVGNAKANNFKGRGGDDTLIGKAGKDTLLGEAGNDTLAGNKGGDTLIGGTGNDTMTGGSQKDVFVFDGAVNEGRDVITDFQNGLDLIQIEGETFADLTIRKINGGTNSKIILDSGTEIILQNVVKADIDASDFDFI